MAMTTNNSMSVKALNSSLARPTVVSPATSPRVNRGRSEWPRNRNFILEIYETRYL